MLRASAVGPSRNYSAASPLLLFFASPFSTTASATAFSVASTAPNRFAMSRPLRIAVVGDVVSSLVGISMPAYDSSDNFGFSLPLVLDFGYFSGVKALVCFGPSIWDLFSPTRGYCLWPRSSAINDRRSGFCGEFWSLRVHVDLIVVTARIV